MEFAERMSRLGTETAFEVLSRARTLEAQGREIVHLEIGEPDFDTPSNIMDAACEAMRNGATHYVPSAGIPELRQVVAREMGHTRDQEIDPEQVVITPGAKSIMFFTILALGEPGKEIIYPNPAFPIYESMINFVGAKPVPILLREERGFRSDVNELADLVNDRTALIILNSPQNPTGGMLQQDDLEAIAEICVKHDIPVLSDEVYDHMVYEGSFASISSCAGMSTKERTILLNSFSKTYAMTGWRLGYGVMPLAMAEAVTRLMVNSNSCTCAFNQWAGVEALTGPQEKVGDMMTAFRERRDIFVEGLNELPDISCVSPRGAFYAFPNITATGMDSEACANFFMEEAGVACLSGTAFGEYGEDYLRFSYANSVENLQRALECMEQALVFNG